MRQLENFSKWKMEVIQGQNFNNRVYVLKNESGIFSRKCMEPEY